MIVFRDVVKRFGAHVALDGFSFPVARGEIVALLGPNGSGKTTTLKIAAGLIRPDRGEVGVGAPPRQPFTPRAREVLSFLPQRVVFPEALTGMEVVDFYRRMRGVPAARGAAVMHYAALNGAGARPVAGYSGGMVQRLGLAVAMLPDAPILLLDEPTAALDPEGLAAFHALMSDGRQHGRTVLFTSHQVADVEQLADRVALLVRGRLVAEFSQSALRDRLAERGVVRVRLDRLSPGLLDRVRTLSPHAIWENGELIAPGGPAARLAVIELLRSRAAPIRTLTAEDGRLDTLYRELVIESDMRVESGVNRRPQIDVDSRPAGRMREREVDG